MKRSVELLDSERRRTPLTLAAHAPGRADARPASLSPRIWRSTPATWRWPPSWTSMKSRAITSGNRFTPVPPVIETRGVSIATAIRVSRLRRPPVADQRLADHVLRADALEVEILELDPGIGERGPGLPDDEPAVLGVGVAQAERVDRPRGAGTSPAKSPSKKARTSSAPAGRAELDVQPAGARRDVGARSPRRSCPATPTGIEFVRKRSSVPSGSSVSTTAVRIRPPNLIAASVPGMRIEPGKSPAETMSGGSSGDFWVAASTCLIRFSSESSHAGKFAWLSSDLEPLLHARRAAASSAASRACCAASATPGCRRTAACESISARWRSISRLLRVDPLLLLRDAAWRGWALFERRDRGAGVAGLRRSAPAARAMVARHQGHQQLPRSPPHRNRARASRFRSQQNVRAERDRRAGLAGRVVAEVRAGRRLLDVRSRADSVASCASRRDRSWRRRRSPTDCA